MIDAESVLKNTKQAIGCAGGPAEIAEYIRVKLGEPITAGAVCRWKRKRIPASRVLLIESLCDGRFARHELRPDIYPPPAIPAGSAA